MAVATAAEQYQVARAEAGAEQFRCLFPALDSVNLIGRHTMFDRILDAVRNVRGLGYSGPNKIVS